MFTTQSVRLKELLVQKVTERVWKFGSFSSIRVRSRHLIMAGAPPSAAASLRALIRAPARKERGVRKERDRGRKAGRERERELASPNPRACIRPHVRLKTILNACELSLRATPIAQTHSRVRKRQLSALCSPAPVPGCWGRLIPPATYGVTSGPLRRDTWTALSGPLSVDAGGPQHTLMCSGSEEGSYLRFIDFCITQL